MITQGIIIGSILVIISVSAVMAVNSVSQAEQNAFIAGCELAGNTYLDCLKAAALAKDGGANG